MGYKTPMGRIVYREDGTLHTVKYRVCIKVEKKNKILVVKWDPFVSVQVVKKLWGMWGLMWKKGLLLLQGL